MIFNNTTYLFVHDQDILRNMEENHLLLRYFPKYKWVFLGHRSIDNIKEYHSNIILARDYDDNIEEYPNAVAYTGWYLLYKNNIINDEYVNLFEYDIKVLENRNIPREVYDIAYFKQLPISRGFKELASLSSQFDETVELYDYWMPTTNLSFRVETFNHYMQWFHDYCFDGIKNDKQVGHILERFPSYYSMLNRLSPLYIPNLLKHFQINSHHDGRGATERVAMFNKYNTK